MFDDLIRPALPRFLALVTGFFTLPIFNLPAQEARPPRVLVLFSNDRLLPANQRIDEGMRRALDPGGDQSGVGFYGEFLDAIRLGGATGEDAMDQYLRRRYREMPPDVLVALGPEALKFLVARRESLFPGTPLLFCGVSRSILDQLGRVPGMAGLPLEMSVAPAVEALLKMRPQTQQIVIVHGSSDFDRKWRDQAVRECARFAGRVKVSCLPELPLGELKARLKGLPSDSGVVYLSCFQSPDGETYTPGAVAREIAGASPVPVVGPYDTYMDSGLLGVWATPFYEQGTAIGHTIRRVVSGEPPESIGILPPVEARLIVDDRQVRRWGIRSVPAGAEIRNELPSLWEQHRSLVILTLSVVVLQGVLIAGLVVAHISRKRTERELRRSEARFAGVFRCSPTAMSIVRKSDGRIVDVNPVWEKMTGVRRVDAVGRAPFDTGVDSGGEEEDRLRMTLGSGKILQDYEMNFRTPAGRSLVLGLSSELLMLNDEAFFILVANDITAQWEAEEARQRLAQKSRLAMLGEMTASIAHEINQPLAAILSNADAAGMLIEDEKFSMGELKQILADIRRDDLRASTVIKRVRSLVAKRGVSRSPVDFNQLAAETVRLATPEARRRGVTLDHVPAPGSPVIYADAVQIEQVVLNLLFNAFDAMKDTPAPIRRVIVRSSMTLEDSVMTAVEDNGHGIPPDQISRLFDSLFTTKEGGMGLGLALAQSIIEAHGGGIGATNNPSRGATFYFTLPLFFPLHPDHAN